MLNAANTIIAACENAFFERHSRVFHEREELYESTALRGVTYKVFAQNVNEHREVSFEVELFVNSEQVGFGCYTLSVYEEVKRKAFYLVNRLGIGSDGTETIVVPNQDISTLFPEQDVWGVAFADWAKAIEDELIKLIER